MSYLVGVTAVMAVFLAAVVAFLASRAWKEYEPGDADGESFLRSLKGSPLVWVVSFLLVVGGVAASVVVFVSGPPGQQALVSGVLVGVGALLLVGYVGYGTFTSTRAHGHTNAVAAMLSAWALGTLLLFAVTASLLLA
ncbi:hypothetical protein [Haloarchaeobius sp. FL176]|uniref:hypothetical protein n=1 Tax=Haloarchaeobius sp. FL176 TaxID=2967129 RepID=UPI002148901B|nr:hypothetical protein [Haloarchaeobius sp. FL176]